MLAGFCFGGFFMAGGGIIASVFHVTPWLTLWWGIGVTAYVIAKDYWLPGGKRFRYQPQWLKSALLTAPWSIALHTGINYGIYIVLHWTTHLLRG